MKPISRSLSAATWVPAQNFLILIDLMGNCLPGTRAARSNIPACLQARASKENNQFYPKLFTPLNLYFMFNWGYDWKWVKASLKLPKPGLT